MKRSITTEEHAALSDDFKSEYVQDGTGFTIKLEGDDKKLNDFRTNNKNLEAQLAEVNKKFVNIDVDKYNSMVEKDKLIADKKLIDSGRVDELIQGRVDAVTDSFKTQLESITNTNNMMRQRLSTSLIDSEITQQAATLGAHASAIPDIVSRANNVFKLNDLDQVVAMNGEKELFNNSGQPLSTKDFITGLTKDAPHLFQSSTGGNIAGSNNIQGQASKRDSLGNMSTADLKDVFSGKKKNPEANENANFNVNPSGVQGN